MADVTVRELKQRLSEYLDRAERGELVRVTDQGRPKALLGPLPCRARVEEGVAEGWIAPGSGASTAHREATEGQPARPRRGGRGSRRRSLNPRILGLRGEGQTGKFRPVTNETGARNDDRWDALAAGGDLARGVQAPGLGSAA